jgi:hypothetical protein
MKSSSAAEILHSAPCSTKASIESEIVVGQCRVSSVHKSLSRCVYEVRKRDEGQTVKYTESPEQV